MNKKIVFFPHCYRAGIKQIWDLFYSCEGHFLPFNSFCNKFNVNVTFYNIIAFFLLFPKIGRKYCKKVSKTQLRLPPQSVHCHARLYTVCCLTLKSGAEKSDLTRIYLPSFKATREIKLTMFNTKSFTEFYQRIACYTKMKKVASPSCPFCPSECQTLWHLFINCMHANSFWNRFQEWYSISSNTKLLLSELKVMFRIIRCRTYCLALNHLVILGKYFLYVNASAVDDTLGMELFSSIFKKPH